MRLQKIGGWMSRRFTLNFLAIIALAFAVLGARAAVAGPALLLEARTGKILYAEDADKHWHPASLTKMMTAYLTFEAIKNGKLTLDSKITCSWLAHKEQPSKIGLPVGAKIKVSTALDALVIKSANDVAVMLAEAIGGTHDKFVAKMNATARRLGMTRTYFQNPNGLPAPKQVTTARDLAKLSQAIFNDYPQYNDIWKKPNFRIGRRRISSHNGLLKSFTGADGMKTGFICDSGYNVVASATRDGRKLIAVVLGARSGAARSIRARSLLEHGFRIYDWKQLFNTTNISNMPMQGHIGSVVSIRKQVRSAACGYYRPRRKRSRKQIARAKARAARKRRARLARAKSRTIKKGTKTAGKKSAGKKKIRIAKSTKKTTGKSNKN